ncbi:MAG: hypothetical protein IKN38_07955 [Clostridia bacterium]|nr:hypothetical protein [Clostridia bacterium]
MNKKQKRNERLKIAADLIIVLALTTRIIWLKIYGIRAAQIFYLYCFLDVIVTAGMLFRIRRLNRAEGTTVRRRLKSFIKKIFRPVSARRGAPDSAKNNYLKGETKTVIKVDLSLKKKLSSLFDPRVKASLKKCRTSNEKVRMLFIRKVLKMRGDGREAGDSKTPRELEALLGAKENAALFETYTRLRYSDGYEVGSAELSECEK